MFRLRYASTSEDVHLGLDPDGKLVGGKKYAQVKLDHFPREGKFVQTTNLQVGPPTSYK